MREVLQERALEEQHIPFSDDYQILHYAMKDRQKGLFYPARAMKFEEAILVSVTDASHAASFEKVGDGQVAGHRSQSGRVLMLADPSFLETGEGQVHVLEWHSNTIKRICRSTLQSETLSLQLGTEEAEHVRQVMFNIKNLAKDLPKKEVFKSAMDHMTSI